MAEAVHAPSLAAASVADAIRAHLDESRDLVLGMPRAGPSLSVEDARQLTTACYLALADHLDGRGSERRESFIVDAVPAIRAAGLPAKTMIVGVVRAYLDPGEVERAIRAISQLGV